MRCTMGALILVLGLSVGVQAADRPALRMRNWLPPFPRLLNVPGWLQTLGGAERRRPTAGAELPEIAAAARRDPIEFQVPAEVLKGLVEQSIDETHPVQDVILQVPLLGTAQTTGAVRLELVENDQCAVFDILISGTAEMHTIGNAGKANVHSRTIASYAARKRLVLDEHGLKAYPAVCQADARSTVKQVTTSLPGLRGRFVRRIGWRRANDSVPEADRISARHTEQRVCELIDKRVAPQVDSVNLALSVRKDRGQEEPLRLRFCTSNECLSVAQLPKSARASESTALPGAGRLRSLVTFWLPSESETMTAASQRPGAIVER